MTPKQKMIESLYKALEIGVSKIIKNGLAFTIMLGAIAGLVWGVFSLLKIHRADRAEWKAEKMEIRAECAEEINRLRVEVYECNELHLLLLSQVARLEEKVNKRKR